MNLENIADIPEYEAVKDIYIRWAKFVDQNVEFWLPSSELHTKSHSRRVMLLALIIGRQNRLTDTEQDALAMAAAFHDSRRLDDGLDQGHGRRAAHYYEEYCREHGIFYDEMTSKVMEYHDQDDALGVSAILDSEGLGERSVLLYQIFKDADALDRFRLGPDALDPGFLRTKEAPELVNFAKVLLYQTQKTELNDNN